MQIINIIQCFFLAKNIIQCWYGTIETKISCSFSKYNSVSLYGLGEYNSVLIDEWTKEDMH
jgi:hypothetical protein